MMTATLTMSEMNFLSTEKKSKSSCYNRRRRIMLKRSTRKYFTSSKTTTITTTRVGFLRSTNCNSNNSHFFCKAVVLLVILEGLGCGFTGATMIAPVEGTPSSSNGNGGWQSNQYQQQSSYGGRSEDGDDSKGGGGTSGDSYISTFTENRSDTARRMRDRCGRYSLLKVLQQWETLQRRCRLNVRNILNNNMSESSINISGYHYYEEDASDRYDFLVAPPSLSDDLEDDIIKIDKRSHHHYQSSVSKLQGNNNNDDRNSEFRNYYYEVNEDALESCCPVVFEVIAPIYGRNRSGHMVELYKDENVQQKFNEYRCHKDYLQKSCRFVEGQYRRVSKCVQQYLDTYALVRSDTSMTGWSMEHIRVASGCTCKVDPTSKRRKKVSSAQQQRRNQRRSQQFRDAEVYRLGNTLTVNKKNSKGKSSQQQQQQQQQQAFRFPGFSEY